mmetsp:Transcript_2697/g.3685  ORF Transcript_2697/g.3685 Transcript_2697/m.3685 type:complete len:239 (-) Transcript_2697:42-758(-)|eukprot:CAMPEP_0197297048 /NCGR_PEP_ID=MMETSP0890-20130614/39996_1 /TAXON_ID=44058 ORGANISM="Aureoumbra lagunensis, Strain CCMP1510" /NCGR_SAMPLE_ID=MMETSP0890 /ASSEMBLY_ACC=CAM_ASM_000533 /LENGTH=238 /DNA_ID=CAMNT_0042773957 /DNA_START=32 /DNA_END=748 /DNA_ORIENTATION=-
MSAPGILLHQFGNEQEAPKLELAPREVIKKQRERNSSEPRRVEIEMNIVAQSNGSARVKLGNTEVICALRLLARGAYDEIVQCEIECLPGLEEIEIRDVVTKAIKATIITERLPKVRLSFHFVFLGIDGGEASACIAAASVTIAAAGVECLALVIPLSINLRPDGTCLVDPASSEEDDDDCMKRTTLLFAFLGTSGRTALISRSIGSSCSPDLFHAAAATAKAAANQVQEDMATSLRI